MKKMIVTTLIFSILFTGCVNVEKLSLSAPDYNKVNQKYSYSSGKIYLDDNSQIQAEIIDITQDSTGFIKNGSNSTIYLPNHQISKIRIYKNKGMKPGQFIGTGLMLGSFLGAVFINSEECKKYSVACTYDESINFVGLTVLLFAGLITAMVSTAKKSYVEINYEESKF